MPKTSTTMQEMFDIHVPYELGRLEQMYRLLLQPDLFNFTAIPEEHRKTIEDALIVGFCSHARNLIEFFEKRSSGHYACAQDFATDEYEPLRIAKPSKLNTLKMMLNTQINHLTYERTDATGEKIDVPDRKDLCDEIHAELVRWKDKLKTESDKQYVTINTNKLADARALVAAAIGASSSITDSTSVPQSRPVPLPGMVRGPSGAPHPSIGPTGPDGPRR